MRAVGFAQGQRGDVVVGTVAARAFKERFPDAHLDLGINKRYQDMLPLFEQHSYFDSYRIWEGYDDWPTHKDIADINNAQYDTLFDAMPKRHNEATWWQTEHQAQSICLVNGLKPPTNLQCSLIKWFDVPDLRGYIAFNFVGGFQDYPNKKSFSVERASQVVNLIRKLGFKVIVIGDPKEPELPDTERKPLSYLDSVKTMLGCRALIGIDSGLGWVASAYSHPALLCYANGYYGKDFIKNIQPVNPNATYVDALKTDDIDLDILTQALQTMLT